MIDFFIDERLFSSHILNFELPYDDPRVNQFQEDYQFGYHTDRYVVTEVSDSQDEDGTFFRHVEAESLEIRLADIYKVGGFILTDVSVVDGFSTILDGSGWVPGFVEPDINTYSFEKTDASVLDLLWEFAKVTNKELRFNTQSLTIDILTTIGANTNVAFRYAKNLLSIKRTVKPPQVTRLYPYGRDDLSVSGITGHQYIEDYTYYTDLGLTLEEAQTLYRKEQIWVDTSFVDESALYAAALSRLDILSRPSVTYEASVIDLSRITGIDTSQFRTGDYVQVQDGPLGIDVIARVSRRIIYPYEPDKNKIELAFSPILIPSSSSSTARSQPNDQWFQFAGPVRATYQIRNDGDYIVARIPLRFRKGGRANFHLDLWATGVNAGDMVVTVLDTANGETQQFKQITVPYTNGSTVRAYMQWAAEVLEGEYSYAVRVTTVATGGPSSSKGVNITLDVGANEGLDVFYEASWWIMAQGAVRQSPTAQNSVRFEYTGTVQTWTVPDNVEGPITIECAGAGGESFPHSNSFGGSAGQIVTAIFPSVIPGTIYDIRVGSNLGVFGGGASGDAGTDGTQGGDYSAVTPTGQPLTTSIIVGGGGGGGYVDGLGGTYGGDAGYPDGASPTTFPPYDGAGGTQSAGGAAGLSEGGSYTAAATAGSSFQGGQGGSSGSGFNEGGGGGGGGWYGGGGGGSGSIINHSGGGGSSYIDPAATDVEFTPNAAVGYVEIRWEVPDN